MKSIFFIPFFFLCLNAHSQNIYTSSFTQTWPDIFNTEVENINRSISFEENAITMATENKTGKEIEVFYIQHIRETRAVTAYSCITAHGENITIIKPLRPQLKIIDIFRTSAKTGEEIQYRLHLN